MPVCVFEGCMSGSKQKNLVKPKNVHLHRFPKDVNLRNKWLNQITRGSSIKNVNFEKGKYSRGSGKSTMLQCSDYYTNTI